MVYGLHLRSMQTRKRRVFGLGWMGNGGFGGPRGDGYYISWPCRRCWSWLSSALGPPWQSARERHVREKKDLLKKKRKRKRKGVRKKEESKEKEKKRKKKGIYNVGGWNPAPNRLRIHTAKKSSIVVGRFPWYPRSVSKFQYRLESAWRFQVPKAPI